MQPPSIVSIPDNLARQLGIADDPPVPKLDPLALQMEMDAALLSYAVLHSFKPGQRLRGKKSLSQLTDESDKYIVFHRYLVPQSPLDMEIAMNYVRRAMMDRVDCLVAYIDGDLDVSFLPSNSRLWEPAEREIDPEAA